MLLEDNHQVRVARQRAQLLRVNFFVLLCTSFLTYIAVSES